MSVKSKLFKVKNWICFLLVAVILLSGVCFEQVKVQSFFAYSTEHQQDAFVKEVGVKLVTTCSSETMGLRNTRLSNNVALRLIPGRRILRTLVLDIPLVEQFGALSTFFSSVGVVAFEKEHAKSEVVFYIHRSDGKKRA